MKKLLLVGAAAAAAAAIPTSAYAGTFGGVVVARGGGSIAVAAKAGAVRTFHSRAHARVGARVLVNGAGVRVIGTARSARIHGVVVRRVGRTTFLAAGRSLLSMRSGPRAFTSTAAGVAPGAVVNATVAIANGRLTQQAMQVVGEDERITVQATVSAVGPGTITVSVNGQSLTIALPAGIQLPASLVGQTVTLVVRLDDDEPVANPADEDDDANEIDDDDHGVDHGGHGGHDGGGDHGH
jgi:hypothetical protein